MGKVTIPSGNGDSGALNSYLRHLGQLDVPTPEEQQTLCSEFALSAGALHRAVSCFAFTAREMLMMLDKGAAGESELTELFLPSSFENGKLPPPSFFLPWRKEIAAALDDLEKAFSASREHDDTTAAPLTPEALGLSAAASLYALKIGRTVSHAPRSIGRPILLTLQSEIDSQLHMLADLCGMSINHFRSAVVASFLIEQKVLQ